MLYSECAKEIRGKVKEMKRCKREQNNSITFPIHNL